MSHNSERNSAWKKAGRPYVRLHSHSFSNPSFIVLIGTLLAIDLVMTLGNALSPGSSAEFTCRMLPIAELSAPTIFVSLRTLVDHGCLGTPTPHDVAIMSFMLKLVGVGMSLTVSWLYSAIATLLTPSARLPQGARLDTIPKPNGSEWSVCIGLFLFGAYLALDLQKAFRQSAENIFTPIAEDFGCLAMFLSLILASSLISDVFFSLLRRARGSSGGS